MPFTLSGVLTVDNKMATHQLHYFLMERYDELKRARHKIRCLLRDKKDADAQIEELEDENILLIREKVHAMAVALVNHGNVLMLIVS